MLQVMCLSYSVFASQYNKFNKRTLVNILFFVRELSGQRSPEMVDVNTVIHVITTCLQQHHPMHNAWAALCIEPEHASVMHFPPDAMLCG